MSYEPLSRAEKMRLGRVMLDLRTLLLLGRPSPAFDVLWQRCGRPERGDWVFETSTLRRLVWGPPSSNEDALWDGQFIKYFRRELRTHLDDDGEPDWTEMVDICENPDETEYVWTNAALAVAPLDKSLVEGL